jgi:O-acetylserine/cysteine efflux transporter
MSPLHLTLALLTMLIWGLNFVVVRLGLATLPPLLFSALRFLLSAIPLVFFVGRPAIPTNLLIRWGITQFALQFGLLFTGLELGMPAGLTSLVIQIQAFLTIALSVAFLGERPGPLQIVGAIVSLAGLVVAGLFIGSKATLIGFCLVLAAGTAWASANFMTKRMGKIDPVSLVAWGSLVAVGPLAFCSLIFEGPGAIATAYHDANWISVGAVLYQSYANTLLGYTVWSYLVARYPSAVIAPLPLLVPIVGMASGTLMLGEPMPLWKWVAAALVLGGLALNQMQGAVRPKLAPEA